MCIVKGVKKNLLYSVISEAVISMDLNQLEPEHIQEANDLDVKS